MVMCGGGEDKWISTYHIYASGVLQAAHPLQRCHTNSCSLENHTTITHTNKHRGKKELFFNLIPFHLWAYTVHALDCRCSSNAQLQT